MMSRPTLPAMSLTSVIVTLVYVTLQLNAKYLISYTLLSANVIINIAN